MNTSEILRTLSDSFGVAGFETEVQEKIKELIEPYVDDIKVDRLGNLIAQRRGKGKMRLLLDAHMDEVGFIVKYIEESGYLRFAPLGGWDNRIIPAQRVTILLRSGEKICGVIGTAPPHILDDKERTKVIPIDEMFIDVGATSRKEIRDIGIHIGDPLVIHYPFTELTTGYVTGKAFDDRAGCAVLIEVARNIAKVSLDIDLVFAFVIGEEVGLRGARTAAYQIDPDIALAIEGTIGADMPGIPEARQPVRLGKGPAITVADRSIIVNPRMVKALERVAEEAMIPYQYKLPTYGGTDAGAIHLTKAGVISGVVSVPCRYIHSPISILRLNDLEHTIHFVTEFVGKCHRLLSPV
ncbi:M42 family metallopeptidase [Candidatus Bipolaricaulota bacterium]|nr:M42 family metallopeptidase [Candidatus Bipolaricaulota bacterium]